MSEPDPVNAIEKVLIQRTAMPRPGYTMEELEGQGL